MQSEDPSFLAGWRIREALVEQSRTKLKNMKKENRALREAVARALAAIEKEE